MIFKIDKKKDNDGTLSAFADIYEKLRVQNDITLELLKMLFDNGVITYNQMNRVLLIMVDMISDPELREKRKAEIRKDYETANDRRMDPEPANIRKCMETDSAGSHDHNSGRCESSGSRTDSSTVGSDGSSGSGP